MGASVASPTGRSIVVRPVNCGWNVGRARGTFPASMELNPKYALMPVGVVNREEDAALDANASPFKVVVDPVMRARLKKSLFNLIDHHDEALAGYVSQGKLSLESYKEYVELFARSLRETMDSPEGVLYLLKSAGLEGIAAESINLTPEWRWR